MNKATCIRSIEGSKFKPGQSYGFDWDALGSIARLHDLPEYWSQVRGRGEDYFTARERSFIATLPKLEFTNHFEVTHD